MMYLSTYDVDRWKKNKAQNQIYVVNSAMFRKLQREKRLEEGDLKVKVFFFFKGENHTPLHYHQMSQRVIDWMGLIKGTNMASWIPATP